MDTNQRPKLAILSGKDTWSTWSNGLIIYLHGKDAIETLTDPHPINPNTTVYSLPTTWTSFSQRSQARLCYQLFVLKEISSFECAAEEGSSLAQILNFRFSWFGWKSLLINERNKASGLELIDFCLILSKNSNYLCRNSCKLACSE
jgi:hypothetical protein